MHSRRTRGDRHSSRVEAKKPALLSSRDGYLLEYDDLRKLALNNDMSIGDVINTLNDEIKPAN